jgi:hypothetical protein
MFKFLYNLTLLVMVLVVCHSAEAQQPPPLDSVTGTLAATGKAGTGTITTTFSGNTAGTNSTLILNYYQYNGMAWVFSGSQQKVLLTAPGSLWASPDLEESDIRNSILRATPNSTWQSSGYIRTERHK